jgi:hypothetical protein
MTKKKSPNNKKASSERTGEAFVFGSVVIAYVVEVTSNLGS